MSRATVETLYAAAASAFESGDYATAIAKATLAKLRLATMADTEGGETSVAWKNVREIDSFIRECRQMQNAAAIASGGAFQQTKITYERPDTTDDYA